MALGCDARARRRPPARRRRRARHGLRDPERIPTPVPVQGGVVRQGNAHLRRPGPTFGSGGERIVRLSSGAARRRSPTGFSSLGGFDIDATTGNLYVVDNCFGADSAAATRRRATRVYRRSTTRPRARRPSRRARARSLPSGTFATPRGRARPSGRSVVLIADAVGPARDAVVEVVEPTTVEHSDHRTSTSLARLATDGTYALCRATSTAPSSGSVGSSRSRRGAPAGTLIGGLSGSYGARRSTGRATSSSPAASRSDFSSSTRRGREQRRRRPPERAHGFRVLERHLRSTRRAAPALVLDFAA